MLRRLFQLVTAIGFLAFFGACEHAKFRSDEGHATPWAQPEGFENTGAGTPFGLLNQQGR